MAKINTKHHITFQSALVAFIRIYRFAFSLLLGHCCRFEPSCSTYGIKAIEIHGCFKGCYLLMRRLLRCHPWHSGGTDPVPQPLTHRSRLC